MTDQAAQAQEGHPSNAQAGHSSLWSRILGVIFSPVVTFGRIAQDPRPVGLLAFAAIVPAAATALFLSTEVGKLAMLDETVRRAEAFFGTISDVQYAAMERAQGYAAFGTLAQVVAMPLIAMAAAGILKAVFAVVAGAEATFKQVLAVVAASGVILALRQVFVLPLNYVRESKTSTTNLGVFLPMLPEGSFPARLLGTIDLFVVWWLAVLASGLATTYRRPVRTIAITLLGTYGMLALGLAAVLTFVGRS